MDLLFDNLDLFWSALLVTIELSALSFVGAMIVGTAVTAMRVSPVPPLRAAGRAYVEAVRSAPPLVPRPNPWPGKR